MMDNETKTNLESLKRYYENLERRFGKLGRKINEINREMQRVVDQGDMVMESAGYTNGFYWYVNDMASLPESMPEKEEGSDVNTH